MIGSDESRSGLQDHPFSYRSGNDGRVFVSWRGAQVMILKGARAASFLSRIADTSAEAQQLVMAKITGNFKRGNESKRGR